MFYHQFPEYQKFFNDNFSLEFRKKLLEIEQSDSEINSRFHEWRTRKKDHPIDTLVSGKEKVSVDFQKMIEKFGFPAEKKVGYCYHKADIIPTFVILV
ncbi:hypothetical protein [Flavobacterium sp. FlaQc-48]|uniref:hypothetical protein n=1 Tax=Flavobacterium sp. FlaQc-48 TaxID=3374181 RepID=UPI0037565EF4